MPFCIIIAILKKIFAFIYKENKFHVKKRLIDFALVTAGAFIAAVGFNCFFLENNIASGGVVGLAVSLKALFGWNPGNFVMFPNFEFNFQSTSFGQ